MSQADSLRTLSDKEVRQTIMVSALGAACIGGSATLVFPFLPLFLLEVGATEDNVALWNSIIVSGMFVMGAIVMPIWGALADRFGMRKMILRAAACLSISYFLSYFAQSPWELLGARIFQGFSFGFIPISQALLLEVAGSHAGTAIGILLGGRSAGTMMGPFLGGVLGAMVGLRLPFLLAAVIDLVAFALVFLFVKEPPKAAKKKKQKKGILASFREVSHNKDFMKLIGLMIINQCAMLIINPLIAVHVMELTGGRGNAVLESGLICGAAGIAGVLAGPFWGRFGERKGFYLAMMVSFLGAGIFSGLQYLAPTVFLFGLGQFGFGFFTTGGMTSIAGAIPEVIRPEERGSAFGINAAAMNIGNCMGPLLGGGIATLFGEMAPVFMISCAIQILAAGMIFLKIRNEK